MNDILKQIDERNASNMQKLCQAFTVKVVDRAVSLAFDFHFAGLRAMQRRCFEQYEEAAFKHMPFKDREALVDQRKIEWIRAEELRLKALRKNYQVKPIEYCVTGADYDYMKAIGFRRFVELHLQDFIY